MAPFLLFLLAAVLFSCNDSAPGRPVSPPVTTPRADTGLQVPVRPPAPDFIARIREVVTRINTEPLRKEEVRFTCDEAMAVDFFYRGDTIVKIAVDFGTVGDVYAKEEYYYDGGQLLFLYEFVEGGPACEGCLSSHEYRSYIRNNRVIRYLKDGTATACRQCAFSNTSRQYKLLTASGTEAVRQLFCKQD